MRLVQYVLSLLFARFGLLIALILLSFVASPSLFGEIAVANANVIILAQVCGSWIQGAALRGLSLQDDVTTLSTIALASWLSGTVAVLGACVWGLVAGQAPVLIAAAVMLAISLVAHDVVLAQLNARAHSGRYLIATTVRGALLVTAPIIAFQVAGGSPAAALVGFAVAAGGGAIVGIFAGRLHHVSLRHLSPNMLKDLVRFGVAATFANAFLVVSAGVLRNAVFHEFGPALAGRMSLTLDIVTGLFSIVSAAVTLRFLPEMYKAARSGPLSARVALPYVSISVYVCLAMAMTVWMVPTRTIGAWLPAVADRWTGDLAYPLIIFISATVLGSTGLTVLMAANLKKRVVGSVAVTISALITTALSATMANAEALTLLWVAAGVMVLAAVTICWLAVATWPLSMLAAALSRWVTAGLLGAASIALLSALKIEPVFAFALFLLVLGAAAWRFGGPLFSQSFRTAADVDDPSKP